MSADTTRELTQLLAADERDVGFLEYLPDNAVAQLAGAIRDKLEAQRSLLDEAIAQGTQRLPAGLGGIAKRILG